MRLAAVSLAAALVCAATASAQISSPVACEAVLGLPSDIFSHSDRSLSANSTWHHACMLSRRNQNFDFSLIDSAGVGESPASVSGLFSNERFRDSCENSSTYSMEFGEYRLFQRYLNSQMHIMYRDCLDSIEDEAGLVPTLSTSYRTSFVVSLTYNYGEFGRRVRVTDMTIVPTGAADCNFPSDGIDFALRDGQRRSVPRQIHCSVNEDRLTDERFVQVSFNYQQQRLMPGGQVGSVSVARIVEEAYTPPAQTSCRHQEMEFKNNALRCDPSDPTRVELAQWSSNATDYLQECRSHCERAGALCCNLTRDGNGGSICSASYVGGIQGVGEQALPERHASASCSVVNTAR